MKERLKFIGIIVLAALIIFSMSACDEDEVEAALKWEVDVVEKEKNSVKGIWIEIDNYSDDVDIVRIELFKLNDQGGMTSNFVSTLVTKEKPLKKGGIDIENNIPGNFILMVETAGGIKYWFPSEDGSIFIKGNEVGTHTAE